MQVKTTVTVNDGTTATADSITAYVYDLAGNLISQTDGVGNTITYEYNAFEKVSKAVYPRDETTQAENTIVYQYDVMGNLAKKKILLVPLMPIPTINKEDNYLILLKISYTYDDNGNQLTMTDATGQTVRTYDELNRVATKTVPQFGTNVFQYDIQLGIAEGYAEDGYVGEKSIDSKGNEALKVNDKAGRLKVVKSDSETTGTVYQYDGNGNRTSVTYENGAKEVYTYYDDNLLATLTNYGTTGNIIESYQYTYDAAHNQKTKVDAKGTTSYTYDTLNRLIKVLEPIGLGGKLTEYGYDKAGNRLTERIINGSQTTLTMYAYDERNRLLTTTLQTPTGSREISKYVYDNNGNTLQKTKETTKKADPLEKPSFSMFIIGQTDNEFSRSMVINEYNSFNQLVTTKTGAQIANYVYKGEGRRVQKSINGQATNYLYEYDKVVLETDGKGKQTARNVYGINLLSRTIDSQKVNYLYNGHADVTALIDATGTKVASYYYDAFGNPLETTGTISNPIRYVGYQYDTETGLYYLNERYYDSKIARFLTEDTFRGQDNDPLSLNLYTYCHNEPIMYSDPTGHRAETLGSKTGNDNAVFATRAALRATQAAKAKAEVAAKAMLKATATKAKSVIGTINAVISITQIVAPMIKKETDKLERKTLESIVQNNSPVGNWIECFTGKTLITGEELTYEQRMERNDKGDELFESGLLTLGIGGTKLVNSTLSTAVKPNLKVTTKNAVVDILAEVSETSKLNYKPTSGVDLVTTPGKSTTVLGTYAKDTGSIVNELGNVKSINFEPRDNGFNVLNVPDELYQNPKQFWNEYNKPWLDNAIERNDTILMATKPEFKVDSLLRKNSSGKFELSGFGKEYSHLRKNGYVFNSVTNKMIK